MNDSRTIRVRFVDRKLYETYLKLKAGKTEEKRLAEYLERAIQDLKKDPFCGIQIPRRLWPKDYVRKYGINNLRKYDLPNGWRLVYTLVGNQIEIVSILLEWFKHKEYEKRFHYKVR
ncbi:type II toxin-antitoxin system RelE/ParE family toxin [Candidatus Micrarchaeota archaeon]|nr:type II toxin-antitoxin system RelE/ParE family toxin [Candidatus Micrarchaeota archaeon]